MDQDAHIEKLTDFKWMAPGKQIFLKINGLRSIICMHPNVPFSGKISYCHITVIIIHLVLIIYSSYYYY